MLKDDAIEKILREYDEKHSLYSAFTLKQQHLLAELLQERSFSPHSVTSRVKSRQSLKDKLNRTDADYAKLSDVTDVSGVRITTYFHDEVDKVASYLDGEFEIVKEQSVDKRKILDADRFGYLSLHYIVKLSAERLKLTEYRRFPNLACEIQVRSILQHAWAEIEHDLGYKSRIEVPQPLRRRFSRLAGFLELADEEFATIRDALSSYQKNLPKEIKASPAAVTLDKLSLAEFLKSNLVAQKLDEQIASFFGAELWSDANVLENDLQMLSFFEIKTISDLEVSLNQHGEAVLKFAKLWINSKESRIGRGICLLYLSYLLAAQTKSEAQAMRFLNTCSIGLERDPIVKNIFDTHALLDGE
ncbi:MAG: hypothetical protein IH623_13110 [Verrucomicrobia bacterium]|nr:hypothetical protein [Verrucomicrobiota bacterium]